MHNINGAANLLFLKYSILKRVFFFCRIFEPSNSASPIYRIRLLPISSFNYFSQLSSAQSRRTNKPRNELGFGWTRPEPSKQYGCFHGHCKKKGLNYGAVAHAAPQ